MFTRIVGYIYICLIISLYSINVMAWKYDNYLDNNTMQENHVSIFILIDEFIVELETIHKQVQLLDNEAVEYSQEEYDTLMCLYEDVIKALRQGNSLLMMSQEYRSYNKRYEKTYRYLAQQIFSLQKKIQKMFSRTNVFPGIFHNDASGNASSSLIVDADIDPAAAIEDTKLATIATAGKVSNSATTATSLNTLSAIVARDNSGNFSAGTISASLSGNATTATTATNFSGSLVGDVTGAQSATVVSFVGGKSASSVASAVTTVNAATNLDTASTLVMRDANGNFAAGNISMVDGIASTLISSPLFSLPTTTSVSVGTIQQNGVSLLHTQGTNNTFLGQNAGSFLTTGTGNNTAIGTSALTANTTGANNTAVGKSALVANTSGADNTVLGSSAGVAITSGNNNVMVGYNVGGAVITGSNNIYIDGNGLNPGSDESNTIRIGKTQTGCFVQGINGTVITGSAVLVSSSGQLGALLSSAVFKENIRSLKNESELLYDLNPVLFTYKSDATHTQQYGLIAEEVDLIFPQLVVRNNEGAPYTVRYELLPVLLLKEIQKHKSTIEQLSSHVDYLNNYVSLLAQQVSLLMRNK